MFFTIFIVVFYLIKVRQSLFHAKYMHYIIIYSAAPISGPFDASIDPGLTFNASIRN